jgi:hypothetical protein
MSPATTTAEMDLLIADPAPGSVSGLLGAVFTTPPLDLCPHLAVDLAHWPGEVYVRMPQPTVAVCWVCLVDRERVSSRPVCCRCRTWPAGDEGFTYLTVRGRVTAVGRFCSACTTADLDQAGMVVLGGDS